MSGTPIVVTFPCALVRDPLRGILANSRFRPFRNLPALDGDAENYLGSAGIQCSNRCSVGECHCVTSSRNDIDDKKDLS